MTRNELKQLIRETIEEQMIQESLPQPKSELGRKFANRAQFITYGVIHSPEHEGKVRSLFADIVTTLDDYEAKHPEFK